MKKFNCLVISVLFLTVFIGIGTPQQVAQNTESSSYAEAITAFEEFAPKQMALDKVPGISVGFIKDGFIWTKGFGYSDLENLVPAKPESSYRLASITKTITAIAVLQLVEAGKIDLDAEVQTYVPYFPKKKWPVTIRLLLGHLGGISHYRNYDVEGSIKVHKDTKEALAIFQDFDLVAQPGTRYNYSSYGYNLLGAVVESASGVSFGEYIKKHIFEPLDMQNSRLDDPVAIIPNRVRGYRLISGEINNSEYVDISSRFAAGGTRSTVVDLLKYAEGIMEGKLLRKETWNRVFSSMANRAGLLTGYGMGWGVRPLRGHFLVSHGGGQPETTTYLLILPEEKFAVAFGSNLERTNRIPYVYRLAELVLDEDVDGLTYVDSKEGQAIYDACYDVFTHGVSQFNWLDRPLARVDNDLETAFSYFNRYVDEKALNRNFEETNKKIDAGVHPVSKKAFTKVGSFMAYTLSQTWGREKLKSYYKTGPIAFFNDYIKISRRLSRTFRFKKDIERLMTNWQKDWAKVYTVPIRRLFISVDTDFEVLDSELKHAFGDAKIYPDLTREMTSVAAHFRQQEEIEQSFKILNLAADLYPNSPSPLNGLAATQLWAGNTEDARRLFKKAFSMNPDQPGLSLNAIFNLASSLENAKKMKEIFSLAEISTELYPKNSRLHKEIGDMYLRKGDKAKAVEYYKKALTINPKYEDAKKRLAELEPEKHE